MLPHKLSKFNSTEAARYLDEHLKKINEIIRDLERSLMNSDETDRQMLMCIRMDYLRNQSLNQQLEETRKENNQMINILQQKCGDNDISRSNSKTEVSSTYSTMSMVHLQYKYEELVTHHNGLLKILETRTSEIRRTQEENYKLKEEIENLKSNVQELKDLAKRKQDRIVSIRKKKNKKIFRLKMERDTLTIVHNQLVLILNKQCMERDALYGKQMNDASQSEKALLLKEIRKNNILSYENVRLQQEVEYLRTVLKCSPVKVVKSEYCITA